MITAKQEPVPGAEDSVSSAPGRPHGTYAKYKLDKCRCYACSNAASSYNMRRERLIAYGRWQPFTDAEPVREHARSLMAAGVGWKRIANLSGVSPTAVNNLLYGKQGRVPTRRVRPGTAAAILALRPEQQLVADHRVVDATGYRRRMQALVAVGFPGAFLAGCLGVTRQNLDLEPGRVLAATDRRVRRIYDELWNRDPLELGVGLHSRNRARNYAADRGWPLPQNWDDERIDDPKARPRGVRKEAS